VILLARSLWHPVHQLQGDQGFGSLRDSAEFRTVTIPVPGSNPDIDTTSDLLRLEELSR
jgi:CTP:molybdopterin cytidylyltransferase MocA